MKTVGVREAKGRLSQLLREVRRGQEWVITERGVPVAKLSPIRDEQVSLSERLRRLEAVGLLEPSPGEPRTIPSPLALESGLAQRWLRGDREE